MHENFKKLADQLEPTLKKLLSSEALDINSMRWTTRRAGVYLLSEKGRPTYVGRTRHLKQRINSHYSLKNPNMGSFAFLIARENYDRENPAREKKEARKTLHANPTFKPHLEGANKRIRSMTLQFVDIEDANLQHVFELYAAVALGTPYNKFDTH